MRKLAIGLTFSTILLGAVAYFLRKTEIDTVFDPVSGLTNPAPVTYILAGVSACAALVIFLFALGFRARKDVRDYETVFRQKTLIMPILSFLLFGLMVYAAFSYYDYVQKSMESILADSILALFAALSGVAFLTISINTYRRKNGPELPLCCFVIVIFFCYWLIMTYKQKAADPVLLDYVYDALALCSAALAAYYITGFCYHRGSVSKTLFFTNLSVYLCLIASVGSTPLPIKLFYIFTISVMLISSVTMLKNMAADSRAETAGEDHDLFDNPSADAHSPEPDVQSDTAENNDNPDL
jgi:hypothetical protein